VEALLKPLLTGLGADRTSQHSLNTLLLLAALAVVVMQQPLEVEALVVLVLATLQSAEAQR
jgi:hypothetical protein